MSAWPVDTPNTPILFGAEGELVSVRLGIDPRSLEDLLECLAEVPFPINPRIVHGRPTFVEFPAYDAQLDELRRMLKRLPFELASMLVSPMIESLATAHSRGSAPFS